MWIIDDHRMHAFFSEWNNNSRKLYNNKNEYDVKQISTKLFFSRNADLNYETMQNNLHMIFGDNANVEKQICLFDDVLEFLQNVVQVDGADRLFSKHFYDMEWNMFLEADFEKSEMKIYRDHFVHQIRNAYLGYYLIWEMELHKNIEYTIKKYETTGFSQFINIYKFKEQQISDANDFYQQVIMKTWFLAALFHDIGYPLAYHQRYSAKMDMYMPYLRVLDNRRQMDFVELSALLADTYLFKMVDYEDLKIKYEKFDHGMLSAICLLLNYYHTGAIHRLSNADRCSIELAAYAIFIHTRKYSIQENEMNKKSKFVRPVFVDDPIAYMLRLCDDLQEWARVYFIVGENSNALICNRCKKTIVKQDDTTYICKCGNSFNKTTSINYRKINLVEVCKSLKIDSDGNNIVFTLDYDLLKLLEVLNIDKQYAKFREKELANLKKILPNQALLPKIDIKYFLSNNHMEIKIEIFRRYLVRYIIKDSVVVDRLTYDLVLSNKEYIVKSLIDNLKLHNEEKIIESLHNEINNIELYLKDNTERKLFSNECIPQDFTENIYLYKEIDILNNK